MVMRTITLTVDQPRFFDEVSKYGLINSSCPIGSRVIACLLGGVDWREAMGLGVYGVQVFEDHSAGQPSEASTAALPPDEPPSSPPPVEGGGEQKRAKALLRAVERFIREENAHARRARREEIATGQTIQSHDLLTTTRDEVDLAHADLVASFTTEDCRAARRLLSKAPTSPPQATNSEVERTLARRAYVMSEPHLSGHRVVIGFESREHAMAAHEAIARLGRAALDQGVGEP